MELVGKEMYETQQVNILTLTGILSSTFLLLVYGSKYSIFFHNEFFHTTYESNCSECEFPEICVLDSVLGGGGGGGGDIHIFAFCPTNFF